LKQVEYWDWAEEVLKGLPEPEKKTHRHKNDSDRHNETGMDLNQNNIVNVDLAYNNLNLVDMYAEVGKFAKDWLVFARKEKLAHDSKDGLFEGQDTNYYKELLKEHSKGQCKGYFRRIATEKYVSENEDKIVYVFLQFQSMTGKKKFIDAFKLTWWEE